MERLLSIREEINLIKLVDLLHSYKTYSIANRKVGLYKLYIRSKNREFKFNHNSIIIINSYYSNIFLNNFLKVFEVELDSKY